MTTATVQAVPLENFHRDQRVRERLNPELVEQIAQSFLAVGQLEPVSGHLVDGRVGLLDGHHRLEAGYKAGFKTLDCIIKEQELSDGAVIQHQLIANCLRENPSSPETARAVKQLMDVTGWKASQISANTGFSPASVTRMLAMLSLPGPILAQVEAGKIPPSAAYELSQITDPVQQAELAAQLADGRLTRDAVKGARKAAKRPAKRAGSEPARVTAILGESRSVTVASAGLTLERFIELIEELLTKARRVRTQGVELSTFIQMLKDQARAG